MKQHSRDRAPSIVRPYANITLRPKLLIRHGFAYGLAVPPSLVSEGGPLAVDE